MPRSAAVSSQFAVPSGERKPFWPAMIGEEGEDQQRGGDAARFGPQQRAHRSTLRSGLEDGDGWRFLARRLRLHAAQRPASREPLSVRLYFDPMTLG